MHQDKQRVEAEQQNRVISSVLQDSRRLVVLVGPFMADSGGEPELQRMGQQSNLHNGREESHVQCKQVTRGFTLW